MAVETDNVEDIYELSPMQRGMLFHTLYAPHSGVYIEQTVYSLQGSLDIRLLREAWRRVIAQHTALRSAFFWEELDEPMQVVYHVVQEPWEQLDWRELKPTAQHQQLDEMLATNRRRGFDLAQPPLLRLLLTRVADDMHLLILTYHHLLLDGWSQTIVAQEVFHTYEMLLTGREPQLKLRLPYRNYITWLRSQKLAEAETFWRLYLQGFTTPTPLLLERSSSQEQGAVSPPGEQAPRSALAPSLADNSELQLRGGRPVELQGFTFSREATAALYTFARRYQLTLNTLLQGAWALLLSRYGVGGDRSPDRATDVVFGATVAGRPAALTGAEAMVGLFINTLPVRVPVVEQADLLPWLAQLQAQQAEAREYDYSPLVQVHGWSDIPREQSLFESLVVFENYHIESMPGSDGEESSSLSVRALQTLEQTNYALVLIVGPGAALKVQLGYETARFSPGAIRRALDFLRALLENFIAHPHTRLADISLLNDTERRQLLTRWNQPATAHPRDVTLSQLLQQQAVSTPEAIALVAYEPGDEWGAPSGERVREETGWPSRPSSVLTYAELDRRANQLAHYLRRAGVGSEVRVGLCMGRSPDLLIGLLGILKAGGVSLPLVPGYPQERLAFLLADAQTPVLLTQRKLLPRLSSMYAQATATAGRIICVDSEWADIEQESVVSPPVHLQPDNAAYVIYTSGSTGTPKGVVVTQQALLNHCTAVGQSYELQATDRVLQFASIGFDVALEELFPSWLRGAAVVMGPDPSALAPAEFSRFLVAEQLTVLNIPSSYWHEWVSELARPRALRPATLRLVIVGSEKVSAAHFIAWHNIMGNHISWRNAYGLTETTITSLIYAPENARIEERLSSVPIGKPINNIQVYILDTQYQPVPIGMPGELYIGGAGLARGYLHRSDLTAERFLPHPFSDIPGARLYRTGDLVRYQEDGNLEFLGRADSQVKLRGFRVEPGEIAALIRKYPGVRDAFVIAQHEQARARMIEVPEQRATKLVAYVVVARRATSLQERLQRYLEAHLPAYMVPAGLVLVETVPRTPGGKVDLLALTSLSNPQVEQETVFEAPRTPVEEILANIWAAVLRLQRVGRQDHFFRLGGHSLQATQIIARIREALHVDLPVRALYDAPTVDALGEYIQRLRHDPRKVQGFTDSFAIVARDRPLPLSFAQQRVWLLMQMEPQSSFYTMSSAVRLQGVLDVTALEQSINALVRRHESLRTTFALVDDLPMQIIAPNLHLAVPLIDLLVLEDPKERAAIAERVLKEDAHRIFDLSRGPLLYYHLLRLTATEHLLLLSLHHIIADGWSIGILVEELNTLYTAYTQGQIPTLPPLSLQYADYAYWQHQWLEGEPDTIQQSPKEELLAFWREQLGGAPAFLELPTDYPRPPFTTFNGAFQVFQMPFSLCRSLRALSQSQGVTLFMTLLATFQVLLMRYTEQEDLVIGTPIAGRRQREAESIIGLFLNTLILRADLSGNPSFSELLARVREVCLNAYEHQDLPFEKLIEELQPVRSPSYTPLFQVLFALQNLPDEEGLSLPGLTAQPMTVERGTAKFDLTFFIEEHGEELAVIVEYNTDLFKPATISRMAEHYQHLLGAVTDDPQRSIWTLPLLAEAERTQILTTWNDTKTPYPHLACIHDVYSEQATRTPDAIALVYDDQQMTYQELNTRANRLAHYLQRAGVSSEVPVGISLERSPDMIVGLLGILKAGGAYIPLDPQYPEKRLAFLTQDVRVAFLLTQGKWRSRWQLIEERIPMLCLDSEWDTIAQESATNPVTPTTSRNLAYLMYTSGSTGQPKGVSIAHQSVLRLVKETNYAHLTTEEIFLHFAPLAFDASTFEIWGSLLNGAKLVLFPVESPSLHELGQVLQREHVTTLWLTAGLFHQMAENHLEGLASVQQLLAGGDVLSLPHIQKVLRQRDTCQLINGYGPTENTTFSSTYPFPRSVIKTPDKGSRDVVPIGRAISNTTLYVLDCFLQPVPVGVPGELYVGGEGLARGYLGRPSLTADCFIPHPFTSRAGERLYRTGDRVRWLPDGNLAFLGRIDRQQVKVRGFRIELGEIEAVLKAHPGVQDVVVIAREDRPGERRLVAYVIPAQTTCPTSSELRKYVRENLPDYMVPSAIVQIAEFPLNPNGKVDRRKLPTTTREQLPEAAEDETSASTEVEHTLAKIWSEVLGLSEIKVHDNFFELGGDSIQVIQVCAYARAAQLHLTPRQMFQYQTIAQLATAVTFEPVAISRPTESEVSPGPVPLTPIQHWFISQALPEPHHWNQAMLLSMPTPLHIPALLQALESLLQAHAALHLRFSPTAHGWLQELEPANSLQPPVERLLPIVDLTTVPSHEQAGYITHLCSEVQASLDLQQAPLLRGLLLLPGSSRPPSLLLVLHHLIVDAVSWSILLSDLSTAYQQASIGQEISLPAATTSFPRFAQLLQQAATTQALKEEAAFWLTQGQQAEDIGQLPRDWQESKEANSEAWARAVVQRLGQQETAALLHEVPRAYQTQINDVLLTALAETMRAWTGKERVLVNLEGHGRKEWELLGQQVDLSRSVGWFTVLYPVLLDLSGRQGFSKSLPAIKEQLRRVPGQGQGYGLLRYLVQDAALSRQLAEQPAPEISFNYLGQVEQVSGEQAGFQLSPEDSGPSFSLKGRRSHVLDLLASVRKGQLQVTWIYSERVHARSTIEDLARRYFDVLKALIEHCLSPEAGGHTPSDFPLAKLNEKTFSKIARLLEKDK